MGTAFRLVMEFVLFSRCAAHVSMIYLPGQPGSIRNAGSATGNGRASVAGACGGQNTFGVNGVGTAVDGERVTLGINYAAGHRSAANAFRFAFACGTTTQAALAASSASLSAATHNCVGTVAGVSTAYSDSGALFGIPAPDAIVAGGYTITCDLPSQSLVGATAECTMSLLDQRNWGG